MKLFSRYKRRLKRLKNESKEKLNEVTIKDLKYSKLNGTLGASTDNAYIIKKTPSQRAHDSHKNEGFPINQFFNGMSMDGIAFYSTTSQTFGEDTVYSQRVQFVDFEESIKKYLLNFPNKTNFNETGIKKTANYILNGDVKVYCSCVKEGTLIKVEKGWKKIEDIKVGDLVLSSDGNFYKVHGLIERKNLKEGKVKNKFLIENSPFALEVTNTHKVLYYCNKENKIKKEKSSSIKKEDSLLTAYPYFYSNDTIDIGCDKARCLGFYFINGFSFEDKICLTVNSIKKITSVIESLKIAFDDIELISISPSPINKANFDIVIKSEKYSKICNGFIEISDNQRKIVPEIYNLKTEEFIEFIFGMFILNGGGKKIDKTVYIITNKEEQTLELQCFLRKLNIFEKTIYYEKKSLYYNYINKAIFAHCYERTPIIKEILNVEIKENLKQKYDQKLEEIESQKELKKINIFKIIKYKDTARYFDISLLEGPHDYMANGYFVSNCKAFLYWGWKYIDWVNDAGIEKETRFPAKNNPKLKGMVCKHLWQILEKDMPFRNKEVEEKIKNYIKVMPKSDFEKIRREAPPENLYAGIKDGKKVFKDEFIEFNFSNKDLPNVIFAEGTKLINCSFDGTNLTGSEFYLVDLHNSHFEPSKKQAVLVKTKFIDCNLRSVDFTGAIMTGIVLDGSNLTNSIFYKTELSKSKLIEVTTDDKVYFNETTLNGTIIQNSKLEKSVFNGVNLLNAHLENNNFDGSVFINIKKAKGAHFEKSTFRNTSITKSDFSNTYMQSVNFEGAKIEDVDFINADLSNVILKGASLKRVKLTNANLSSANIIGVKNLSMAEIFLAKNIDSLIMSNSQKKKFFEYKRKIELTKGYNLILSLNNLNQMTLVRDINFEGNNMLIGKDLSGKYFRNVEFIGIIFNDCDLRGCHFEGAVLTNCFFVNANLENCNFTDATIRGCNFISANFKNVDLTDAIFEKGILKKSNITKEQLSKTKTYKDIKKLYNTKTIQQKEFNVSKKKQERFVKQKTFEQFIRRRFWKLFTK